MRSANPRWLVYACWGWYNFQLTVFWLRSVLIYVRKSLETKVMSATSSDVSDNSERTTTDCHSLLAAYKLHSFWDWKTIRRKLFSPDHFMQITRFYFTLQRTRVSKTGVSVTCNLGARWIIQCLKSTFGSPCSCLRRRIFPGPSLFADSLTLKSHPLTCLALIPLF